MTQPGIYRLSDIEEIPVIPENVDRVEQVVEKISALLKKANFGQFPLDDRWKDAVRHKLHEGLFESSRGNPRGALPRVADTQAWDGRSQFSGRLLAEDEMTVDFFDDRGMPSPYTSVSRISGDAEASNDQQIYTYYPLTNAADAADVLLCASEKSWISPRDVVEPVVEFLKWLAAHESK